MGKEYIKTQRQRNGGKANGNGNDRKFWSY